MGEADLQTSGVLVDVLTPSSAFAHFSINDLELLDQFCAFAKHLKAFGVVETPLRLSNFHLEVRPATDFSEENNLSFTK